MTCVPHPEIKNGISIAIPVMVLLQLGRRGDKPATKKSPVRETPIWKWRGWSSYRVGGMCGGLGQREKSSARGTWEGPFQLTVPSSPFHLPPPSLPREHLQKRELVVRVWSHSSHTHKTRFWYLSLRFLSKYAILYKCCACDSGVRYHSNLGAFLCKCVTLWLLWQLTAGS